MEKIDTNKLKKKMFLMFPLTAIILGLAFFLPAGTFNYWQAWLFMATLFIPFAFVASYLIKNDPELAERRMRFKEKVIAQKKIIDFSKLFFFIGILIPGFDYRYGWSSVPVWLVILSNIFILLGYFIVFLVFKENKYTSRIIEVEKGQKVISTGPYSVIRHPMYAGVILMFIFMPIALGSYWALIPFFPAIAIIIPRILNEEKVLLKGLKGYEEYTKKVRYRLMPGVW
jgi:protein-S-isoprenylcysteine O-methyltransferase Ste14